VTRPPPTSIYAVLGNPVAHSQSPWIHTEFARQTGQSLRYDKCLVPEGGFSRHVHEFAASSNPPAHGCNITIPFKTEAFFLAQRHTKRALLAAAANTLRFDSEGWLADNTDGVGLVQDIQINAGVQLQGLRILLIGAGGAASGALGPLLQACPEEIIIANRTLDKAQTLVHRHQEVAGSTHLEARNLDQCGQHYDVVINASSSSLAGRALPVATSVFKPGCLALDMMYGPAAQFFIEVAAQQGAMARDGLGMLVEQAAEAFHLWLGIRPHTKPVLAALRQRLGHSTN